VIIAGKTTAFVDAGDVFEIAVVRAGRATKPSSPGDCGPCGGLSFHDGHDRLHKWLFQNTFADCPEHVRLTTSDPDSNGLDRVNLVTRADPQIPSYGGASKILFDFERVQSCAFAKPRMRA
jgi:hypothetical protein